MPYPQNLQESETLWEPYREAPHLPSEGLPYQYFHGGVGYAFPGPGVSTKRRRRPAGRRRRTSPEQPGAQTP